MRNMRLDIQSARAWFISAFVGLAILAFQPTTVSAVCSFGWCMTPPISSCPSYCGYYPELRGSYWDPSGCPTGAYQMCEHTICWYLDDTPGTCSYPGDVCYNSDIWDCQ